MNRFHIIIGFLTCFTILSCGDNNPVLEMDDVHGDHDCTDECVTDDEIHNTNAKVWHTGEDTYLYGGTEEHMHFKASNWDFITENLYFGLGRETIEALLIPKFSPVANKDAFPVDDRCVVIRTSNEVKIYPLAILRRHEVVNDVVDGEPVFVGYCLLADYVSVLSRTYCGQELTFGVSGWTYAEDNVWGGLQGFVLWDRDTESLWWPLINKAVTGTMNGVQLEEYNPTKWEVSTWGESIKRFPDAVVLNSAQAHNVPSSWPILEPESLNCQ